MPTQSSIFDGTHCGTPDWMAPELRPDKDGYIKYNKQSDVFSMGLIYSGLLTKQPGKGIQTIRGNH